MSHSTSRRFFLKTICAASAVALSPFPACQHPVSQKPNIIYILADDLGYGDLGCYGQKQIKTPHLDDMAAQGKRFTDHYAGSTVCAPSRCSLMTGKHSGHSRIRGNGLVPLQPEDATIGEILKSTRYTTGIIGKWGLGEPGSSGIPTKKGFDYFYGYLNQIKAHNYYPAYLWRNEEMEFLSNEVVAADRTYAKGVGGASTRREDYSHDLFAQEATSFVEKHKDDPFFLYLAYTIPHANNEHWILNTHGMETPDYGIYENMDWPEAQKGFAAMVSRMDRDIGALMQKLRDLDLDKKTLVIFSSDNGPHKEGLNDPEFFNSNGLLRGMKRDLYEGGIRVPMIAWWPGTISPATTSGIPSAFWDILPTFAELAGAHAPQDVDGISLVPTLTGREEAQEKHDFLYWEFHEGAATVQAVRMDEWKAVRHHPDGEIELYHLATDGSEQINVAPEQSEIVAKIKTYLGTARTPSNEWPLLR